MTEIRAEFDGRNGHCMIRAEGHATGSETVCAAVSGLLFALAGYLANRAGGDTLAVWECRMQEADVTLDFTAGEEGQGAFLAVCVGLLQIAEKYPEFVRMDVKEKTFFQN